MYVLCTVRLCVVVVLFGSMLYGDTAPTSVEDQSVKELYVAVGSAVNVPCEAKEGEEVHWMLNGVVLDSGSVLSFPNISLEDRGNYSCHSNSRGLLQTLSLQPGFPPSPPEVTCWSPSYPLKTICSWSQDPEPLLPTRYMAIYMSGRCHRAGECGEHILKGPMDGKPCHPVPGLSRHCVMEGLQLFRLEPYILNVTAINPLGSASRLFIFILEDIVKPDPPVNVTVIPGPGRQLSVEWAPPPTWTELDNFPLKYKVQYYRGINESPRTVGPYESEKAVMKGLRPGSTYHIRVSAQDQLMGQRSDWSQPVSATVPAH
ncbi:hypothetical protein MATL_G00239780 [Megalops atlanticus]|uniref:Epstein-Barr virus induced 3 n=1 Tax=Megalops atlanticus TaxID=7932 RepID=A0A9D3T162_MEGAT|nr:hypothetical protein MATL_G00239780 [Megalops atlanticus]